MKRVLKTVLMSLVGAFLGWLLGSMFDSEGVTGWVWFFMGVPFGWVFLGKYFGHLVTTNLPMMAFIMTVRVVLAGLIGWVLIPIELIRALIEALSKKKE